MIKLHILYNFQKNAWGGGNQFLLALKKQFEHMECYTENREQADVIFFNSYPFRAEHFFDTLFHLKKQHPEKIIVYRLNGPISFIRGKDAYIDRAIRLFNDMLADGIIFQSKWCQEQNHNFFGISSSFETVIYNAPDNTIFNREEKTPFHSDKKIKLIMASWSTNPRKGFALYNFLDTHLNFDKYEATFVGNTPSPFQHIRYAGILSSNELAKELKRHDIFITASENDPCSNALIEALACGLPAVVRNDGGHPELVQNGGVLFNDNEDILKQIEQVVSEYSSYQSRLPSFEIQKTANAYLAFAEKIYLQKQTNQFTPKRVTPHTHLGLLKLKTLIYFNKALRFLHILP